MLKKLIILLIFVAFLIPPLSFAQEKEIDWHLKALELQLQVEQLKLLLEQSQRNERILRSVIQDLDQNKFAFGTVTAREELEDYRASLIDKLKK